jgi:hypothetical protein
MGPVRSAESEVFADQWRIHNGQLDLSIAVRLTLTRREKKKKILGEQAVKGRYVPERAL